MSGFYATDEFGCDPFAAPTVPAVPPSTPVTNPFLQQGQATAATATAIAPTPTPSPLSTSAAASASAAAVMAAKAAAALPTPTSAPTPVGNPFEETDVFAQAPAVIPSPAKPATMAPAAPALVVSPMVAPSPVDAFFGPAVAPTTPVLAPPTLAASGSGSFHSPAPAPVVPVPVAAMAALSLAPPVVVSPAKKPAAPAVDTSDFDPYSPAKRASMSMSASASASASASISASASASAASPVVATSPSKAVTTPAPAPVKEAEQEEEEDWGIEWNKPEQPSVAAPEAKAPAVGSPSKQQQTAAQAATGATTTATATAVPEGVCLARVTTRSIFVREWKPAFWVIINQRLWIYRSKADYKPTDYIHDPFSERIKKCIHLRDNLRVTEMKSKMYPGESKTLYTFSIEDMDEDGGKSLTAKFAAYNYDQLKKLRDEVEERVWAARHVRK